MKNVFLAFLLCFSGLVYAQNDSLKLSAGDFQQQISKNDVQVLDVRTKTEFNSGHISHALQADWTDKDQFISRVNYIDKDKPVYVYCLVGGRSASAAAWMREHGFQHVYELKGGINAWKQANEPLEGMSNEKQITIAEYDKMIPHNQVVLVDFGASWCPPCIKMESVIDTVGKNASIRFKLIRIDAGSQTDLMKTLNLETIPSFIIYKNGKETWRKSGVTDQPELTTQLKS